MKKQKRSAIVGIGKIKRFVKAALAQLDRDRVTVYAAQSSYFSVISIIPLLMLILSLARMLFPQDVDAAFLSLEEGLPEKLSALLATVYGEITQRASASTVSISALSMFWAASRGVAALTRGIAEVYKKRDRMTFLTEALHSAVCTVLMILSVILSFTVLVFGGFIRDMAVSRFPKTAGIFDLIIKLRTLVFFIVLALVFSLIFAEVAHRGQKKDGPGGEAPRGFRPQLAGGGVAALGWRVFSYFFSIYIDYFPSASYIYGSLAAVILFMLWLYFCMVILLVGAQVNKCIYKRKKRGKTCTPAL